MVKEQVWPENATRPIGKVFHFAQNVLHDPRAGERGPDLASVGAGETPIIGIASAVANALYNATQTRIRSLPIRDSRFRALG